MNENENQPILTKQWTCLIQMKQQDNKIKM